MAHDTSEPNTAQVTVWRNLLDAYAQLSAAWQAAADAQQTATAGEGPGALDMPESLVTSFARAGGEAAEALTATATVLANQGPEPERFTELAETQRAARDQWHDCYTALNEDNQ